MLFLRIVGIVCLAAGLISYLIIRKNLAKWAEAYANNSLADYDDDDVVADADAADLLHKGIKRIYVLFWIPHGLELLGGMLLIFSNIMK